MRSGRRFIVTFIKLFDDLGGPEIRLGTRNRAPSCFHSASRKLVESGFWRQVWHDILIYLKELVAGTRNHLNLLLTG
jgi:hypothetical protein